MHFTARLPSLTAWTAHELGEHEQVCSSHVDARVMIVFSVCASYDDSAELQSTDEENEPDLSKMTAAEKKQYLEAKAKRKAEREEKRKQKYGDKYEEMMEKHEKYVNLPHVSLTELLSTYCNF